MASAVKEHRAPVRYSISKSERCEVVDSIRRNGGISDQDISHFAQKFSCARKVIHGIATTAGVDVTLKKSEPRPIVRSVPGRGNGVDPVGVSAEDIRPNPGSDDTDDELALLVAEEAKLVARMDQREADMTAAYDSLVDELDAERGKVEDERERTRAAIRQTAALRRATREDRETLESLRGDLGVARRARASAERRSQRLEEENRALRREMKDLTALLGRLEQALSRSDTDLSSRDMKIRQLKAKLCKTAKP